MPLKRHFTLTIPKDLAEPLERIMDRENFDSESQLVVHMIRVGLAAKPEDASAISTRSQVFNRVYRKTMQATARALQEVAVLLEREVIDENQSRSAADQVGPVQP